MFLWHLTWIVSILRQNNIGKKICVLVCKQCLATECLLRPNWSPIILLPRPFQQYRSCSTLPFPLSFSSTPEFTSISSSSESQSGHSTHAYKTTSARAFCPPSTSPRLWWIFFISDIGNKKRWQCWWIYLARRRRRHCSAVLPATRSLKSLLDDLCSPLIGFSNDLIIIRENLASFFFSNTVEHHWG